MTTNTATLLERPQSPPRWERQLDLLSGVYREAGLNPVRAEEAALADLVESVRVALGRGLIASEPVV